MPEKRGPGESKAGGGRLRARLEEVFGDVDPDISLDASMLSWTASTPGAAEMLARLVSRNALSERYVVQDCVGKGGMGAVLRVWDNDLRRHLAMKVLLSAEDDSGSPGAAPKMDAESVDRLLEDLRKHVGDAELEPSPATPEVTDDTKVRRFLEEAQITSQLDHPGIVPVHEVGLDDGGRVYFTMKLVKGETLRSVFGRVHDGDSDWTTTRALSLLLRVCEAMSYAHNKGVVHRDLKPANIMVGAFGEVYVMDWGLACVIDREHDPYETVSIDTAFDSGDDVDDDPETGRVVGTPVYMAPEQALAEPEVSPAADVYSIGAMVYHLLTGAPPYARESDGKSNRALQLLRDGPPESVHRLANDTPPELVAICEKAMARDPLQRYADTSLLANDMRALLEQRVVAAYETGAIAEARKWVQRNRLLAGSLLTVLVLLAGGGSYLYRLSNSLTLQNDELQNTNVALNAVAQEAREMRDAAEREQRNVLRLSASPELANLIAEADTLWPVAEELIPRYDSWLERAHALVATLDTPTDASRVGHRESLTAIRSRAVEPTDAELEDDWRMHPQYDEWRTEGDKLAALRAQMAAYRALAAAGEISAEQATRLASFEAGLPAVEEPHRALTAEVCQRRTYRFEDSDDALWHRILVRVIGELEAFEDPVTGLIDGIHPDHGWGVARRRDAARMVASHTITSPDARHRWDEAIRSIRNVDECPRYGGWAPTPQVGLLPLWRNPSSGLWEFWHTLSGVEPRRSPSGDVRLPEQAGIVFVLIPPGPVLIGAQTADRDAPHYDPRAHFHEGPVHEQTLGPYFISKYEVTRAQWIRFTGHDPSVFSPDSKRGFVKPTPLSPVENVSWLDVRHVLGQFGLRLPHEFEWECAARGATHTPWWSGASPESLEGIANIDASEVERSAAIEKWTSFYDDYDTLAPVDAFGPNPFGLHGTLGNVAEWCENTYFPSYQPHDLERIRTTTSGPFSMANDRIVRGGSWSRGIEDARSSAREGTTPDERDNAIGVRPARSVNP